MQQDTSWTLVLVLPLLFTAASAQSVTVQRAPAAQLPTHIDGNSPSFWNESGFNLFSSTGNPEMISTSASQFGPFWSRNVDVARQQHIPLWIEAAWRDDDGTIFGWYHHEPGGICPGKGLTAPKIGAVISYDGGQTIEDLGIVLESGYGPNCNAENGFFAGGHGDFSVVLDQNRKHFYFLFTNYGGPASEQGVAIARLAFEDRFHPAGAVRKLYEGNWDEPGAGGRTSPIFPAARPWERSDADSFWGPAIHFNTYLQKYVILMNRACCSPGWPQEGIYYVFGTDVTDPGTWGPIKRLMSGDEIGYRPGYYPQVIGLGERETDSLAGERSRLYIQGGSTWELTFSRDDAPVAPPPMEPGPPVCCESEPTDTDDITSRVSRRAPRPRP